VVLSGGILTPQYLLTPENVRRAARGALAALEQYEEEINRLNVFPVPDGDTGTNLLLTVKAAVEEINRTDEESVTALAKAISLGSLMGARGNSGVILSQIIKGFCETLIQRQDLTPCILAEALENAKKVSFAAVRKPVEGTMLTLINDVAKTARRLARRRLNPESLAEGLLQEAYKSLLRTPDLLPVLKEAGVVDAGARGLVIIAEGLLAGIRGEEMVDFLKPPAELLVPSLKEGSLSYTFCTEFILKGKGMVFSEIEKELESFGDSLMVAGSTEMARVHIHTNLPEEVLQLAGRRGNVSEVRINNMEEQAEEQRRAVGSGKPSGKTIGLVAVANGKGVKHILESLGIDAIVEGGQSMNPSTADLLKAVEGLAGDEIIILPNNKNIILTAQQVAEMSKKKVMVVSTSSAVQSFPALLSFDGSRSLEENASQMEKAAGQVKVGEITRAVRDAPSGVGKIQKDDYIGLVDHEIKVIGSSLEYAAQRLMELLVPRHQVITILAGEGVSTEDAQKLLAWLGETHPEVESELHRGEQPLYYYIIGAE
jgi:DAK2 domain fusion protein YloV